MADILSQEEIDALLSATEGEPPPEKVEYSEDVEEKRRKELRRIFARTGKFDARTRKYTYVRKYSNGEIEGMIEEEKREAGIETRREELQRSYVELGNGIFRKQCTNEEIEEIIEGEFGRA